jgi:nucleoside-diphosphate-sugar epimerase
VRTFIAGATGILGRGVVPRLLARGHEVVGLARSEANENLLRKLGAEARRADLFDLSEVTAASEGCDAVLHLATAIPTKSRSTRADWALNDRIRRDGTSNLVTAAIRNGARFYLQQSVLFVYGQRNGAWVDEDTPLTNRLPSIIESARDMEEIVKTASERDGLEATILRLGSFYSHDSAHTRMLFEMVRKGQAVVLGGGLSYTNPISVDDACEAVALAVDKRPAVPGRVLNVCDDEPVTLRALTELLCKELERKPPRRLPVFVGKLFAGSHMVEAMTASVRCRNQRAKDALGFRPTYPTYREGYPAELQKWLRSSYEAP